MADKNAYKPCATLGLFAVLPTGLQGDCTDAGDRIDQLGNSRTIRQLSLLCPQLVRLAMADMGAWVVAFLRSTEIYAKPRKPFSGLELIFRRRYHSGFGVEYWVRKRNATVVPALSLDHRCLPLVGRACRSEGARLAGLGKVSCCAHCHSVDLLCYAVRQGVATGARLSKLRVGLPGMARCADRAGRIIGLVIGSCRYLSTADQRNEIRC